MRAALISMFRTTPPSCLDRYFAQVAELPDDVHLIVVEGDSKDDTRERLQRHLSKAQRTSELVVHEHGGRHYGQVIDPERFRQRAGCKNAGFEKVPQDAEVVIYVEGDLVWSAQDLLALAEQLRPGIDVIAPSVWAGPSFYDIWGFRDLTGRKFDSGPPYSPALNGERLTELETAGSCLVMRGEVARSCRASDDEEIVGFCKDARSKGFRVFTDWQTRIFHP